MSKHYPVEQLVSGGPKWWFSIADVTVKFADGEAVTVPGQDGLHGDDRVRSDKLIETVGSAYARNVLTSGYPKNRPIELDL